MKYYYLVITLLLTVTLISCDVNQSIKKDLSTGAYSRGNGINCEEVTININDEKDNRNEFVYGEEVVINFSNLKGLTNLEGRTYPGMSIFIIKNEKDTVVSNPNLLADAVDGTDLSPLELHTKFAAIFPYKNDEKYKVFVEIWDDKGDGRFNYELPFTIKENNLLEIKTKGIEYSNIYLWNESLKKSVVQREIDVRHELILILNGLAGFDLKDGKVYPTFSLDITDNSGNIIISNPNLMGDDENIGFNPEDLEKYLFAKINFSDGQIKNPCLVIAKLKDKNSNKELIVKTELIINQ